MAEIFERTSTNDQILVLRMREAALQQIYAPNWTDLRVGMFVSLTQPVNDDAPTGLSESFASVTPWDPADWMWIGLKDNSPDLPGVDTTFNFIGFTNQSIAGTSTQLVTSDLGLGSASYYWRPVGQHAFMAQYAGTVQYGPTTIQSHFYQAPDPGNTAPSGYYCSMLGFRLTRPSYNSTYITVQVPQVAANSGDMLWTNAPTKSLLLANLDPWPSTVATVGPTYFGSPPDTLYAYMPFNNSRLRIHAWGILQKT